MPLQSVHFSHHRARWNLTLRPHSEPVKADVRRRMGPPHHQSLAEYSQELGIDVITLYKWRKAWRFQGEVEPASQKEPRGMGPCRQVQSGVEDRRPQ